MRLRNLDINDVGNMLEWMRDSDISSGFAKDFSSITEYEVCNFIKDSNIDSDGNRNSYHYACVDDKDEYLGTVSLKNIDVISKNAEFAISLRKMAHGTGAAKFATDEILRIAFEELKLNKVYLNVLKENYRANRFYLKFGFIYEGCFKQHICIGGKLSDLNWYRLLVSEWNKLNKEIRMV